MTTKRALLLASAALALWGGWEQYKHPASTRAGLLQMGSGLATVGYFLA